MDTRYNNHTIHKVSEHKSIWTLYTVRWGYNNYLVIKTIKQLEKGLQYNYLLKSVKRNAEGL